MTDIYQCVDIIAQEFMTQGKSENEAYELAYAECERVAKESEQ